MKITVVGAGAIGAAIASELCASHSDIKQVQVCDTRSKSLQRLHNRVESNALRSFQVDARDTNVLSQIIRGSQCVIGCVPPELNPDLAELCLQVGVSYCDLGGNDSIVQQVLALDEQAREKAIWMIPNCGLAPGLINILCLLGIEQFDHVEAAQLRVGDIPLNPQPPFNFRISWSAERIVDDYSYPARYIQEGSVVEAEALTGDEPIHFGEPFGNMEAFYTQGGLSTLTDELDGRISNLDHKTVRWPGHAHQMRFVMGLGFGEPRKIGVRTHLTYRDVLVRRMRARLGGTYEDAVLMRVLIRGEKDGRPQTLIYEMDERFDEASGMTAMMRCTSVPTVAIAHMVANQQISGGGAAVPENVVPKEAFFDALQQRGLKIETEWYDGYVDVSTKEPLEQQPQQPHES